MDHKLQFVAIMAFLPWIPFLFFFFEIRDSGYMNTWLIVVIPSSIIMAAISFFVYGRKPK